MSKFLGLICAIVLSGTHNISKAQASPLSNLMVQELIMNDTVVDFVLLEFDCEDISNIASIEINIEKDMAMPELQTLNILTKEGKYYIKLLNGEEIEIKNNHVGFVTPLGEASLTIPFSTIILKARTKSGNLTNELIHYRN